MNALFEQLCADPLGRLVVQYTVAGGIGHAYLYLLVASRLVGLLLISPSFVSISIPWAVRVVVVLILSFVISPALLMTSQIGTGIAQASQSSALVESIPDSFVELTLVVVREIGLGTAIGLGLIAIFSGLKLGAEWIDRHSGLGMASTFNPDWSGSGPASQSLVLGLGLMTLFLIEPLGNDWHLIRALLQSFRSIPVGSSTWTMSLLEILNTAIQQSLLLGIRVAMPVMATMLFVDAAIAFAARGTTSAETAAFLAIRSAVGLGVLALTATAIPEAVFQSMVSAMRLVTEFAS